MKHYAENIDFKLNFLKDYFDGKKRRLDLEFDFTHYALEYIDGMYVKNPETAIYIENDIANLIDDSHDMNDAELRSSIENAHMIAQEILSGTAW